MAVRTVQGWINTECHSSLTSLETWQNAILSSSEWPLSPTTYLFSTINTYSTPVCQHTLRISKLRVKTTWTTSHRIITAVLSAHTHTHKHTQLSNIPASTRTVWRLAANYQRWTRIHKIFMYSNRQNPTALFSDDRAGQSMGPPRPALVHRMSVDSAE